MQQNLILVLSRRNWQSGAINQNYRTFKRFTDRTHAIREIQTLADDEFEPLGVRNENTWIWEA